MNWREQILKSSGGQVDARAVLLRGLVGNTAFAIVSNNCWGGHIYQALELPYQSPFIGLFIPPDSYLRLVQKFESLMAEDLAFVSESANASINDWRRRTGIVYPIGVLGGDVELHFQHYRGEAEAASKWCRRVARMPRDPTRYFFKFDDRDDADPAQIEEFCALPLANKVCFSAGTYDVPTVRAPATPGTSHVVDGLELGRISRQYFNTLRWISSLPTWVPIPSLI